MRTSQRTRRISAGLSLMILAIGFTLMGLVSILHQPVLVDPSDISSTGCAVGGCASMAIGSIFSFAALLVYRRQPSCLAVARRWRCSAFDSSGTPFSSFEQHVGMAWLIERIPTHDILAGEFPTNIGDREPERSGE